MSDLRPAQDVAKEIAGCRKVTSEDAPDYIAGGPWCGKHGKVSGFNQIVTGWPCPEMVRVTELIEADRREAMRQAWSEGFSAGHNADHNPCWWPSNPYLKED